MEQRAVSAGRAAYKSYNLGLRRAVRLSELSLHDSWHSAMTILQSILLERAFNVRVQPAYGCDCMVSKKDMAKSNCVSCRQTDGMLGNHSHSHDCSITHFLKNYAP